MLKKDVLFVCGFVWLIWFLWFIRLVWFNPINETNQTHHSNQPVLALHVSRSLALADLFSILLSLRSLDHQREVA